ncbi:transcription antiterminator BglG [Erwinia sp. OLTSP20]|uniref:BglG family transcription antiterminator n=1 Tax=unclassified Erwinia TaxID=2622719 RepID=UPI000C196362|nr:MULTISPECIES: PRD domain-containing protein [unclassified Erwinia]PIJ52032.1 transcription antiterminator BglG [Erwinia sp. OAMSP11]PIJ75195.1 transcription antiterminator BglG [Erwinia sp. OLSSP12]PIJ84402.1 transcription antiterminator BglG [Erwinia sp. OLCASP19]PIJ87016.1 transcription antiterminator BglG [Erwinia sp. OLMTSP26]PIJ88579.1 transcription antiterminator BglG [Erwinia sp. OLMDSP33]
MRFPNQRLAQLFEMLQNETLPQEELARRFAVSTRTVRTDISALNMLLAGHGVQLVLIRGEGYQIKIEDADRYRRLQAEQPAQLRVPRTSAERVNYLLIRFLTSAFSLKLEDLADEWLVSRATLQNDMAGVRETLAAYQLAIETKPRYGMKLFGSELAIRTCLTDLLYDIALGDSDNPLLNQEALNRGMLVKLAPLLQDCFSRFGIRMSDDSERYLRLYCAVAVRRISEGYPLHDFFAEDVDDDVREAARHIINLLRPLCGKAVSPAEEAYLRVNIAARRIEVLAPSAINADDSEQLVDYILSYINLHYNYNLQNDPQLRADLLTHIKTMITRVRYQITLPNPLLSNIKQHYPMAWDVTLAAVSHWGKYSPYVINENEVGFLVLHIGVGLERHYNVGYQRHPQVLLVCDTGNSTLRMIQAMLLRKYPQIVVEAIVSQRDYEQMGEIAADFVISTVRISEKEKPVVLISPFPTDYQLEQIGKLVLIDRTRPYMLSRYFDADHFCIIDQPVDRTTLFQRLCRQLEQEGIVDATFYSSVEERESIVSTLLGDGIALPHSLGLQARKTAVFTVLAPQGIPWGDEVAYVVFLLAISKEDYEEAMAIYDLFVTFLRERAMPRLRDCGDFSRFKAVAMDCLSRL